MISFLIKDISYRLLTASISLFHANYNNYYAVMNMRLNKMSIVK